MRLGRKPELKRGWLALLLAAGMAGAAHGKNTAPAKGGAINAEKPSATTLRDPFWPVGYEPEKPVDAEVEKQQSLADRNWSEAMKQIVVQGVSSVSGEYYAIINTETKRVGELVSVEYGGVRYTWRVENIAPPGSVKLRRVSAE